MIKNLVLSAAVGYSFKQIELFTKSLRKFYDDDIYFIVDGKDESLINQIHKYNGKVIKTSINKKEIQFKRYKIYLQFLKREKYNNILLCDSRDIYFQKNPFEYNYYSSINFFLEDFLIKDCPHNSNWLVKTYGNNGFNKIANKTILCSGTVLGKSKKIEEYLKLMADTISKNKYKKKLKYFLTFRPDPEGRGCDQAHANYLVHNNLLNDFKVHKNLDGPIATVFYLKKINFDKQHRLINGIGEPYNVVHQYDKRWNEFSKNLKEFEKKL